MKISSGAWRGACMGLCLAAMPARAYVLWQADPDKGRANFKNVETDGGTQFSVVDDATWGKTFKFARLQSGANRCEAKGAAGYDTKEGDLIYIHVRYRLEVPSNITLTGIMQWKTYDTPGHPNDLNYPLLLRPVSGRLKLEAYKPRTDLWSVPTPVNTSFEVTIGIYQSYDVNKGWVEFWYNGAPITFSNNSTRFICKTLAGGDVNPKWGIYGTNSSAKPVSASYVTELRIGTDYESARVGGAIAIAPRVEALRAFRGAPGEAAFFDLAGRFTAPGNVPAEGVYLIKPKTGRSQLAAVVSPVQ